jgi:DNA-binding response OmpR family regulator
VDRTEKDHPKQLQLISLLVIEGDPGVARLMQIIFASEGWPTDVCMNGLKAKEAIITLKPYDVVVMSYKVPGAQDLELVRLMRALPHRRQTPIVMVTGSGGVEREAFEAGVNEVLHKPFGASEIVAVLRRHAMRSEEN